MAHGRQGQGIAHDPVDGRARETIQRIRRAVARQRLGDKAVEELSPARTNQQRRSCSRQELSQAQRRDRRAGRVEVVRRYRNPDIEAQRGQAPSQIVEDRGCRRRGPPYFSVNGYGVVRPSDGGKAAVLTALSTHDPVGVPANFPVTVADETLPFFPMMTVTIAMPGTLNWL